MNPDPKPNEPSLSEIKTTRDERDVAIKVWDNFHNDDRHFNSQQIAELIAKSTRHSVNGKLMTAEEIAGELNLFKLDVLGIANGILVASIQDPNKQFDSVELNAVMTLRLRMVTAESALADMKKSLELADAVIDMAVVNMERVYEAVKAKREGRPFIAVTTSGSHEIESTYRKDRASRPSPPVMQEGQ